MTVNFTELLENAELTEDVKSALQEAWEGKISASTSSECQLYSIA